MKKALLFFVCLIVLTIFPAPSFAFTYTFEDTIEWWKPISRQPADNPLEQSNWWEIDAVQISQNHPLTYQHDISDDVDFANGDQVTEATLRLDFTNDFSDSYGQYCFLGWHSSYDNREYVRYGFDGNSFVPLGEVDNGFYDIILDVDWLNDDGKLDVALKVKNNRSTATAWLDSSSLFGTAETTAAIPEPATLVLFGVGLTGMALRRRRA